MTCENLGSLGESAAADFLERAGFTITARNYHSRYGEIDIIAKDDKYIIFVEVKSRGAKPVVGGIDAVNLRKMQKIFKTALMYMAERPCDLQPRFDVISITYSDKKISKLEHIPNAFDSEVCNEIF